MSEVTDPTARTKTRVEGSAFCGCDAIRPTERQSRNLGRPAMRAKIPRNLAGHNEVTDQPIQAPALSAKDAGSSEALQQLLSKSAAGWGT